MCLLLTLLPSPLNVWLVEMLIFLRKNPLFIFSCLHAVCSVVKGTLGSVVLFQYGNFCIVGQDTNKLMSFVVKILSNDAPCIAYIIGQVLL